MQLVLYEQQIVPPRLFSSYPAQVQTWAKGPDDIVREIRLLSIPDESYGDDLRTVHENTADLDALTAVTLQNMEKNTGAKKCEHTQKNGYIITMW